MHHPLPASPGINLQRSHSSPAPHNHALLPSPHVTAATSAAAPLAGQQPAKSQASHMSAAQRKQLRQLQTMQSISSFQACNLADCATMYRDWNVRRMVVIQEAMELFHLHKPINFKLPTHEPVVGGMDYYHDIPGSCWHLPVPPGFYLPSTLKVGNNCREVRQVQAEQRAKAASAPMQPAPSNQESKDNVEAAAASPSSASPDQKPPLIDWCLEKLLALDLQRSMEASGVLNSWDEGSHLSVIRTEGDGNCLCHAVMTAVYGYSDPDNFLRDSLYWEMGSEAHKPGYLERFLTEAAREIASAKVLDEKKDGTNPAAASAAAAAATGVRGIAVLDEEDKKAQTKEFDLALERLQNPKNYLDSIHIFGLANLFRRPIIVYGKPFLGVEESGAPEASTSAAASAMAMTDVPEAAAAAAASSSTGSSSTSPSQQPNSMIGIYLPLHFPEQVKLIEPDAGQRNPGLKPICLLYSCGKQGEQGHFSALVPTQDMMPEPTIVPLQQWAGAGASASQHAALSSPSAAGSASASSAAKGAFGMFGSPALPLLPIRFLLPAESTPNMQLFFLHKHLEVQITCQGHYYAKAMINRTQHYVRDGWLNYIQSAILLWCGEESMETEPEEVADSAPAAQADVDMDRGGGGGGGQQPNSGGQQPNSGGQQQPAGAGSNPNPPASSGGGGVVHPTPPQQQSGPVVPARSHASYGEEEGDYDDSGEDSEDEDERERLFEEATRQVDQSARVHLPTVLREFSIATTVDRYQLALQSLKLLWVLLERTEWVAQRAQRAFTMGAPPMHLEPHHLRVKLCRKWLEDYSVAIQEKPDGVPSAALPTTLEKASAKFVELMFGQLDQFIAREIAKFQSEQPTQQQPQQHPSPVQPHPLTHLRPRHVPSDVTARRFEQFRSFSQDMDAPSLDEDDDEGDADMKAAIAMSLAEASKTLQQPPQEPAGQEAANMQ